MLTNRWAYNRVGLYPGGLISGILRYSRGNVLSDAYNVNNQPTETHLDRGNRRQLQTSTYSMEIKQLQCLNIPTDQHIVLFDHLYRRLV